EGQEDLGRIQLGYVCHEVTGALESEGLDEFANLGPELVLHRVDDPRGEHGVEDAPVPDVIRWVDGDRDKRYGQACRRRRLGRGEDLRVAMRELYGLWARQDPGPVCRLEDLATFADVVEASGPICGHRSVRELEVGRWAHLPDSMGS